MVAAQLGINLGAAIGKDLFPLVGPEGVAALRTGLSTLFLLALIRPSPKALEHSSRGWLLPYGLSLGGMNLLFYWAIERIPLGVAAAIEISGPLAVVVFTSRSAKDFFWLALAVGGLLLLLPWPKAGTQLDPIGIAFALGAAACWALYILCGKQASRVGSPAAVAFGMCAACLITLPFGFASAGASLLSGHVLWIGCVVALLSSALPYLLEMKALEWLSSRVFGAITSSAPAIAALIGFAFLGERLTALQWAAIGLVIVACAGCSLSGARPPVARASEDVVR